MNLTHTIANTTASETTFEQTFTVQFIQVKSKFNLQKQKNPLNIISFLDQSTIIIIECNT